MARTAAAPARDRRILLFALLYAALAMTISVAFFPVGDIGVESDFYGELGPAAVHLHAGRFDAANYPFKGPLHSFALVAVETVLRPLGADWYRSAVLLNALCAAGLLLLVHRWARALCDRRIALLGIVGLVTSCEFFTQAHKASSDLLFALLVILALRLLLEPGAGWRRLLAGSVAAALAFLTRYNGIVVPLGVVAAWWLANPGSRDRRRRIEATALLVCGFLLACSPWLLHLQARTGHWLPPANLQNVLQEMYGSTLPPPGAPAGGFDSLTALVAHDPWRFGLRLLRNLFLHLGFDLWRLMGPVGGALALLGLVRLALVRPDRRLAAVLIALLTYRLAMGVVFYLPRFSLPLVPAYAVLGAAALLGSWRRGGATLAERRPGRLLVGLAVSLLLLSNLSQIVMVERESRALAPDYLLSAVVPLQRYARRTGARTLMARKPHLAFLSGLEYRAFPQTFAGPVDLLARARAQGADVIAVSDLERLHYPDRPFLEHLDLAPHVHRILDSPRVILFALGREPGTGPPGAAASSPAAGPAAGSVDRLLERARDLLRRGLPLEGVALLENGWPEIAALEDPQRLAHAHALRGWLAHELGRDEEARTQLQAALGLFRELGDERMLRALEHDLAILER